MSEYYILSNWVVKGKDPLHKVVTYSSDNKKKSFETISVESCICLINDEIDTLNSKPHLEIKSENCLSQIDIYSEGSMIEVFGNYNEYLLTCKSTFIDDWEGMAVYYCQIMLPNLNYCKLKFTKIREKARFWLYCVNLIVSPKKEISECTLFNTENVNKILENSGIKISEKAGEFKKLFEFYTNKSSQLENFKNQSFNTQMLISTLNGESLSKFLEFKDIYQNTLPKTHVKPHKSYNASLNDEKTPFPALEDTRTENLKYYISEQLNNMREDILHHIEVKLNEMHEETNRKLEKILRLLESNGEGPIKMP